MSGAGLRSLQRLHHLGGVDGDEFARVARALLAGPSCRDVSPPLSPRRPPRRTRKGGAVPQVPAAAAGSESETVPATGSVTVRIINVTDVYTLRNFPSLRTLIREKAAEVAGRGTAVSVLTGDFLAPYLLSTLDKGAGMIAMCNETPIDLLTWGNHDLKDMSHADVMARCRDYRGTIVNTNMRNHESCKLPNSTEVAWIRASSEDGTHQRSVALLGILTDERGLYKFKEGRPKAMIEDPWEVLREYKQRLESEQVAPDVIVPLCHLYEAQDERTCKEFDFPVILSGHDHHEVDRLLHGTRLLKAGQNADRAVMLDLVWDTPGAPVRVEARHLTVADWAPDPGLRDAMTEACSILEKLRLTQLGRIGPEHRPFSSVGARQQRCSAATFLLSRMRDALNHDVDSYSCYALGRAGWAGARPVECVLVKGSYIKDSRVYPDTQEFTLELLQALVPVREVWLCDVPGSVIRDGVRETWREPGTGWMQCDDGVDADADGRIVRIGGRALDPGRFYRVATLENFFRASDSPAIGAFFAAHPQMRHDDVGVDVHVLITRYFAHIVWEEVWRRHCDAASGVMPAAEFRKLCKLSDSPGDGEELRPSAIRKVLHSELGFTVNQRKDSMRFERMVLSEAVHHTSPEGSASPEPDHNPMLWEINAAHLSDSRQKRPRPLPPRHQSFHPSMPADRTESLDDMMPRSTTAGNRPHPSTAGQLHSPAEFDL